jgi:electron transfer flavoprotein beta subunit
MRIVVAYKWAPNPQDATVASDGTVDWSRATPALSEDDPVAIELARRLADAAGAELIGVSVGGPEVATPMARKAALARGLDRALIASDAALLGLGSTETAFALAALVRRIGDVDLVLTGDAAVDSGAGLVPFVLAGALGWAALAEVRSVESRAGGWRVEREVHAGVQVLDVDGPAVFSVAADAVTPRLPGMRDLLAAAKRPCEVVTAADLDLPGPASTVVRTGGVRPELPPRKGIRLTGDAAAADLVAALRADGVLGAGR